MLSIEKAKEEAKAILVHQVGRAATIGKGGRRPGQADKLEAERATTIRKWSVTTVVKRATGLPTVTNQKCVTYAAPLVTFLAAALGTIPEEPRGKEKEKGPTVWSGVVKATQVIGRTRTSRSPLSSSICLNRSETAD